MVDPRPAPPTNCAQHGEVVHQCDHVIRVLRPRVPLLGDRALAEDILQDASVKSLEKLEDARDKTSAFHGSIARITHTTRRGRRVSERGGPRSRPLAAGIVVER